MRTIFRRADPWRSVSPSCDVALARRDDDAAGHEVLPLPNLIRTAPGRPPALPSPREAAARAAPAVPGRRGAPRRVLRRDRPGEATLAPTRTRRGPSPRPAPMPRPRPDRSTQPTGRPPPDLFAEPRRAPVPSGRVTEWRRRRRDDRLPARIAATRKPALFSYDILSADTRPPAARPGGSPSPYEFAASASAVLRGMLAARTVPSAPRRRRRASRTCPTASRSSSVRCSS